MKLVDHARTWLSQRRTLRQLRGLSNEALQDIGLTRFDVNGVAPDRFFR